jgi:hypothetical protein
MPNPDTDDDGILDCADLCPELFDPVQGDLDEDGVGDLCDNCPWNSNPGQEDDGGADGFHGEARIFEDRSE